MGDPTIRDGVMQVERPGTRWLSSGWQGGFEVTDAVYNVSVPDGWNRTDVDEYVADRIDRAGFAPSGPALLTGVSMEHQVGARAGSVIVYATVGLSNPAALPLSPVVDDGRDVSETDIRPGTVNVIVETTKALDDGTMSSLLGTVVEAKTATLQRRTGFTGTTTDAVIVGSDPNGETARFAGSATPLGSAARAGVRDALLAALESRYADDDIPKSIEAAAYGVRTDGQAAVFHP